MPPSIIQIPLFDKVKFQIPRCRTAALPRLLCLLLNRLCGKPKAICTLFTNKSKDDFLIKNLFISKILIIFAFKYWHICNELCQE